MKANEFKKILKPLIKQTVKEVLLEEGVLSKIVSEVALGLGQSTIVENKVPHSRESKNIDDQRNAEILYEKQRQERIKRLNKKVGMNVDLFEGTKLPVETNGHSALSGQDPSDKGVDISAIEKLANGKWKQLI